MADDSRRPDIKPGRVSPTKTEGAGGASIWGGYLQSNETDSRLTGDQRYKTFSNNLTNVGIIAAGVRLFLNLVAKAGWRAEPADDSPRAIELAELTEEILNDMDTPWHRIVRRASMYRFYGFGVQEWTAKMREDGNFGLLDVEARPQQTIEQWDTDENGKVLGVVQRSPQTYDRIPLPREKLVYLVDDSLSDSPEGLGLFRHCVEAAHRLRRYEQLEAFGFEGDLRGIPIARAPVSQLQQLVDSNTITAAQKTAIEQPIRDFIDQHVRNPQLGLVLDSQPWLTTDESKRPSSTYQWDISLLDGGSYSLEEVNVAITRITHEIARVLGVEHLLLGGDGAGSWALSKDKSHNFLLIVDSTLKELREQFQKDLLGPLWLLNGWEEDLKPELKTEQVAYRDVEQIAGVLESLARAGVVLDREDEAVAEVFDILGLSRLVSMLMNDPDATLAGQPGEVDADKPDQPDGDMPEDPEDDLNEE
jgi:hypothetical protein